MKRRLFSLLCFLWLALTVLPAPSYGKDKAAKSEIAPDWSYTEKRLKKEGLSSGFLKAIAATYDKKNFTAVVELNTLLFLRAPDHHDLLTNDSLKKTRAFMEKNGRALDEAEKAYGVPGSVIASLLWVETKHGKDLGRFHVPSVFVDLVQADRPTVLRHLKSAGTKYKSKLSKADLKGIETRAKKRVIWAIGELKSLEKMHKKDPKSIKELKGSFAGAFGLPQFLPSSYVQWAKARNRGATPDLTKTADAIHSVAYYLKDNGWRKSEKTHTKALLRYNNSDTYAAAILDLAAKVRSKGGTPIASRDPSSKVKVPKANPKPSKEKAEKKAKKADKKKEKADRSKKKEKADKPKKKEKPKKKKAKLRFNGPSIRYEKPDPFS